MCMYMYKIYPAKIASSSFVVQSCFQIKIIHPLRSQKWPCHPRSRRSERWPGTRKTSLPRQRPSGMPAKSGRVHQTRTLIDSQAAAAVPRGVRDAGQVWPGTRRTSQAAAAAPRPRKASKHAAERFRGLGKRQNAPLNVSEGSEAPKHAAEGFRGLGRGRQGRWREGARHFKFISDLPLHLCPRFL